MNKGAVLLIWWEINLSVIRIIHFKNPIWTKKKKTPLSYAETWTSPPRLDTRLDGCATSQSAAAVLSQMLASPVATWSSKSKFTRSHLFATSVPDK